MFSCVPPAPWLHNRLPLIAYLVLHDTAAMLSCRQMEHTDGGEHDEQYHEEEAAAYAR